MKRILIFSLQYYPYVGGAEVAIKEITDRIDTTEFEFHVLTLRNNTDLPKEERLGNVIVHRMGFSKKGTTITDLSAFPLSLNKYWYQLMAARRASSLHKKYSYDGVWAMMAHSAGIPAGSFKKQYIDIPYLLTLQEGDPLEHIEKVVKPVWPLFVRGFTSANYLQAISTFLLSWGKRMGFAGEGVVIPNGVDVSLFSQKFSNDELVEAKKSLGKGDGDVYLVTTSRLVQKNGLEDVIRALPLLSPTISFLIYGIGPEETSLKNLAKDQGVKNRVRFMGQIQHIDMPRILQVCDIFIRPSLSEGMGNSFIEAMAAGIPVIATQEGGIGDFLFDPIRNPDHAPTGWAVDVHSPEQISHVVQAIIENPEKVQQVTRNASRMVSEKYDWDSVAERMQALFTTMLT